MEKNEAQISGFAVEKRARSPWNNFFFFEKNYSSLFVQARSSKRCAELFLKNWVSRCLSLSNFKVPKNCSSQKIINKARLTKNQENSAHCFGGNYLTNHFVKFLQDRIKPWRVGTLRVCTGYHIFEENR